MTPPAEDKKVGENDALIVGADAFSSDAFRLLELNADVEQSITAGSRCVCCLFRLFLTYPTSVPSGPRLLFARIRIVIVGEPDTRAVLCTPDKSYYLVKEDTSNLRLLTTHTSWKRDDASERPVEIQVQGSANFHYVVCVSSFVDI